MAVDYSRNEAMDVDNAEEFLEMVKKISEIKPEKVRVFIDMKNVEKLLARNKVIYLYTLCTIYSISNYREAKTTLRTQRNLIMMMR